ncbi:MAG: hypothetical protein DRQ56_02360, partial [Gammaproteobacteria bacterium]
MNKKFNKKTLAASVGTAVIASVSATTANADASPFGMSDLSEGYQVAVHTADHKEAAKKAEGKCGEGKCGDMGKKAEKAAEGKCGDMGKKAEKAAEGKCGDMGKKAEKAAEGKCGDMG